MVIFRENTEDVYAGIEWAGRGDAAGRLAEFEIRSSLGREAPRWAKRIRPRSSGIGIKPMSEFGIEAPGAHGDPVRDRQEAQDA